MPSRARNHLYAIEGRAEVGAVVEIAPSAQVDATTAKETGEFAAPQTGAESQKLEKQKASLP